MIVGDQELGDDGKIVASVSLKSNDEIINLWRMIESFSFRCTISYPYLNSAESAQKSLWENRGPIIQYSRKRVSGLNLDLVI